jgi:hypothetical protein
MPIVNFHLVEGLTTPAQDERLLIGAASCTPKCSRRRWSG